MNASAERIKKFNSMVSMLSSERDIMVKLRKVNSFFNKEITPKLDKSDTGSYDYWQCLSETLVEGTGDCDDYAIAKYCTLKILGIDPRKMFFAFYLIPNSGGHLVLYVLVDKSPTKKQPYILDNRFGSVLDYFNVREYRGTLKDLISEFDTPEIFTEDGPNSTLKMDCYFKLQSALSREKEKILL